MRVKRVSMQAREHGCQRCARAFVCMCVCVCLFACVCLCVCVCLFVCVCVCVGMCVFVCVCVCMYLSVCVFCLQACVNQGWGELLQKRTRAGLFGKG